VDPVLAKLPTDGNLAVVGGIVASWPNAPGGYRIWMVNIINGIFLFGRNSRRKSHRSAAPATAILTLEPCEMARMERILAEELVQGM